MTEFSAWDNARCAPVARQCAGIGPGAPVAAHPRLFSLAMRVPGLPSVGHASRERRPVRRPRCRRWPGAGRADTPQFSYRRAGATTASPTARDQLQPGAGATRADAEPLAREAIAPHLQGLTEDGLPIPDPDSVDVGQVEPRQSAAPPVGGVRCIPVPSSGVPMARYGREFSVRSSRLGLSCPIAR